MLFQMVDNLQRVRDVFNSLRKRDAVESASYNVHTLRVGLDVPKSMKLTDEMYEHFFDTDNKCKEEHEDDCLRQLSRIG